MSLPPPKPAPQRQSFDLADWRPARRAWLWVLLAFVAGLLLFALMLSGGDEDVAAPEGGSPTASGPGYVPLPAPLPAGAERTASGMDQERAQDATRPPAQERPRLVETAPPRLAEPVAPPMPESPVALPSTGTQPVPIPGRMPPPRYPVQALRRGESGTVIVRAHIGPDGVPTSVAVAQGSGSRTLDRAAAEAVRRWRFRPAEIDGQPTVGTVQIPIDFNPR